MRQQRHAVLVVERNEPVPERIVVGRHLGLPCGVALVHGLRIGRGLQVGSLIAAKDLVNRDLDGRAMGGSPEGVAGELVQQRRHGDMGIAADRVAQRDGTMRRQLDHQLFGERPDDVHVLLWLDRPAVDGDDGARSLGREIVIVLAVDTGIRLDAFGVDGLDRLVLGAHPAAIDDKLAVLVDGDESAGDGDLDRIIDGRAALEGFELPFDLA